MYVAVPACVLDKPLERLKWPCWCCRGTISVADLVTDAVLYPEPLDEWLPDEIKQVKREGLHTRQQYRHQVSGYGAVRLRGDVWSAGGCVWDSIGLLQAAVSGWEATARCYWV